MPASVMWVGLIVGAVLIGTGLVLWYRRRAVRSRSVGRLDEGDAGVGGGRLERVRDTFPPRYQVVPIILSLFVLIVSLLLGLPGLFALVFAIIVLLLGLQIESMIAERRVARLESQLAEVIDLTVSSLNSGASVINALEYSANEIRAPLRGYLKDALNRIRLGDEPQAVFRHLAERVPLDNVRLFTTAITVNWETGGTLGPTLQTVGQTIRDRIEISRRIRAMTASSRVATWVIIIATYFIALVMWQSDRDRMEEFLRTDAGTWLVAGALLLQAIGLVWSAAISRPKF